MTNRSVQIKVGEEKDVCVCVGGGGGGGGGGWYVCNMELWVMEVKFSLFGVVSYVAYFEKSNL